MAGADEIYCLGGIQAVAAMALGTASIAPIDMLVDIPHLMEQAGRNQLPRETGVKLIQPGPLDHAGLLWDDAPTVEGVATLAAIEAMILNPPAKPEGIGESDRLHRAWHDDINWWGPTVIGATYTVDRYDVQHSQPFHAALSHGYRFNGHVAKLAECNFGGNFDWHYLTLTNAGGYMGMTGGGLPADMRVVDIYRGEVDRLAENWIFIDILHFLNMQGLDVLRRLALLDQSF